MTMAFKTNIATHTLIRIQQGFAFDRVGRVVGTNVGVGVGVEVRVSCRVRFAAREPANYYHYRYYLLMMVYHMLLQQVHYQYRFWRLVQGKQ